MTIRYDPELLDALDSAARRPFRGTAWRHMFNDYGPERENRSGARWNPRDVPAIYKFLSRQGALAEGQRAVEAQGRRMRARRVVFELAVAWLGLGGLLVPSARAASDNLVIIVGDARHELAVVGREIIDPGE